MKRIPKFVILAFFIITLSNAAGGMLVHAGPVTVIRVGYVPVLSQLPLVMSYENITNSDKTLTVRLTRFGSFNGLEAAMRIKAIDFASLPVLAVLKMQIDHIGVNIVGQCHGGGSRLVMKRPGSLEDLSGMLIGVPGLESCENLLLNRVFSKRGMRLGIEYKTIRVSLATVIEDYGNGRIDAIFLPEPYGTILEREKTGFAVQGQKENLTGTLLTVLTVNADFLAGNPKAVRAYMEGIVSACGRIENDIKALKAKQTSILQKKFFDFDEEAVSASLTNRCGGIDFTKFVPDSNRINLFSEEAVKLKILNRTVDIENLVSLDMIRQILAGKKN